MTQREHSTAQHSTAQHGRLKEEAATAYLSCVQIHPCMGTEDRADLPGESQLAGGLAEPLLSLPTQLGACLITRAQ